MFALRERKQGPWRGDRTPSPAQQLRVHLGAGDERPDPRTNCRESHWLEESLFYRALWKEGRQAAVAETPPLTIGIGKWHSLVKCLARSLAQRKISLKVTRGYHGSDLHPSWFSSSWMSCSSPLASPLLPQVQLPGHPPLNRFFSKPARS